MNTRQENDAVEFFYRFAGWSYYPKTQTEEQGHRDCALILAKAESAFLEAYWVSDIGIEWSESDAGEYGYKLGEDYNISCEQATIWHRDEDTGEIWCLASLDGIVDASKEYRRLIRAELALECIEELQRLASGDDR
jgi:Fic family protein